MRFLLLVAAAALITLLIVNDASWPGYAVVISLWGASMIVTDKYAGTSPHIPADEVVSLPRIEPSSTVIVRHEARRSEGRHNGLVAGIFGCIFGTIGIFALGLIFVPLAAICSFFGLMRGASGLSISGIGVSALAAVLTLIAAVTSPSVWIALALLLKPTT